MEVKGGVSGVKKKRHQYLLTSRLNDSGKKGVKEKGQTRETILGGEVDVRKDRGKVGSQESNLQ